jgi:hypothetical protein
MKPTIKYEFNHHWGGEEMWYHKAERWANKQKFPINHLLLGFITWLKEKWIDVKIEKEMESIDKQVKEVGRIWDEEDKKNQEPIIESKPSEVEGLDDISISAPYKIDISGDWNDISLNYRKWR